MALEHVIELIATIASYNMASPVSRGPVDRRDDRRSDRVRGDVQRADDAADVAAAEVVHHQCQPRNTRGDDGAELCTTPRRTTDRARRFAVSGTVQPLAAGDDQPTIDDRVVVGVASVGRAW